MFFLQAVHADVVLQIPHIPAASLMLRSFLHHHHLPPTVRYMFENACVQLVNILYVWVIGIFSVQNSRPLMLINAMSGNLLLVSSYRTPQGDLALHTVFSRRLLSYRLCSRLRFSVPGPVNLFKFQTSIPGLIPGRSCRDVY